MWERQRTVLICFSHFFSSYLGEFGAFFSYREILAVFSMKIEVSYLQSCLENLTTSTRLCNSSEQDYVFVVFVGLFVCFCEKALF